MFVAAAVEHRREFNLPRLVPDVQAAASLGSVHFVSAHRQQIDVICLHVDRYLADRLRGVGVEEDTALMADFADGANILQRADFIVGPHDRDENRVGPNCRAQLL